MKIYTTLLALVLAAGFSSAFAMFGHPVASIHENNQDNCTAAERKAGMTGCDSASQGPNADASGNTVDADDDKDDVNGGGNGGGDGGDGGDAVKTDS